MGEFETQSDRAERSREKNENSRTTVVRDSKVAVWGGQPACSGPRCTGELHPRGLVQLDLSEADDLGGDLDALVVAQELQGLFEGEPAGRDQADEDVGAGRADV